MLHVCAHCVAFDAVSKAEEIAAAPGDGTSTAAGSAESSPLSGHFVVRVPRDTQEMTCAALSMIPSLGRQRQAAVIRVLGVVSREEEAIVTVPCS